MPTRVEGIGPLEPDLLIVGEAPGKYEDEQGKPFVGPSGQMLDEALALAGIHRDECYITNVIKYRPPFNDLKQLHLIGVSITDSIEKLWENEIRPLRPKCILAIGDTALEATTGLTGILNYRGSILTAKDGLTKVVPTIHPAALFSHFSEGSETAGGLDYCYRVLINHDIKRAVAESKTREKHLPERNLFVAHNSLDLWRFIQEYSSCEKLSCDIESINCIPVCVGFAFNKHHAISVPLLQSVGKNALTDMGKRELFECWDLIAKLLSTKKLIGHNYKYDDFKLGLFGFRSSNVYSDTLIKTRVIFPELPDKRLCTCLSLWTREPYYKDEGKEFRIGKSPISQLFLYNARDCASEYELDEAQDISLDQLSDTYHVDMRNYYYNYMMKKHKFYLTMENNGFAVDIPRQAQLKVEYGILAREQHDKLTTMIGYEVNVKSPPQKMKLFLAMGFKPYKHQPTAEDSIVKMLGNQCKGKNSELKMEILKGILEESRIRDQVSRNINFTLDYDDTCKTSYNISATETCRSSTSVLKKPLRPKKLGLSFHTISKHGRLAKSIRSMFVPRRGKVFIQADSSQAEARVVAVLATDWTLLEAFDKIDIHRRTAGLILGMSEHLDLVSPYVKGVDELGKDSAERFTGKKVRHAGNYDMGKRRFMTEFNTDAQKFEINMEISEWKAGKMLEAFHFASPLLRSRFHNDIKDCLNSTRCIIDPFGGVRIFNGRMDEELYKEGYANIPQRTVAHLVQGAGLKVFEETAGEDIKFIVEAHDALLIEVPENNWEPYARLLKKHMEAPIDFSRYCSLKRDYILTIPAEIEFSDTNYAELRKVKLS